MGSVDHVIYRDYMVNRRLFFVFNICGGLARSHQQQGSSGLRAECLVSSLDDRGRAGRSDEAGREVGTSKQAVMLADPAVRKWRVVLSAVQLSLWPDYNK